MKHTIKTFLLTTLGALVSLSASAYDFEVDGIYYKVVSLSTFSGFTCKAADGD